MAEEQTAVPYPDVPGRPTRFVPRAGLATGQSTAAFPGHSRLIQMAKFAKEIAAKVISLGRRDDPPHTLSHT